MPVPIANRPNISQQLYLAELWTYTGPDGALYRINGRVDRRVLSANGLGMPPIEYITDRAPFQHGTTPLDYFLQPRVIQLGIRQMSNDRQGYWDQRSRLINGIRPNRTLGGGLSTGVLQFQMPNGDRRAIAALIQDTPTFPTDPGRWDAYGFSDVLRFMCFNPVWYDPDQMGEDLAVETEELVFPITFPIIFGSSLRQVSITYSGNWLEYPTLVIVGPCTTCSITNTTTGETITLDRTLAVGETVTIDLSFAAKTVTLDNGVSQTNVIGSITSDSDLATFHLAPDPEAAGGVNLIVANMPGSGATSSVSINWLDRYLAI